MKKIVAGLCFAFAFSALAEEPKMDMSKMGSPARKPTDEKKTKKDIEEFFKQEEALASKGDLDGMVARIDFPIFMATDDMKGAPEARQYSKDEYVAMMKPMFEHMPKDAKTAHKPTISVLSDSLVSVVDDWTMTNADKTKVSGRNNGLIVKVDGQWKWKTMVEAGWGGMAAPPAAADTHMAPSAAPGAAKPADTKAATPSAPAKK